MLYLQPLPVNLILFEKYTALFNFFFILLAKFYNLRYIDCCFQELSDTEGFNEECEHQNPTRQNNGEVSNDENDVDDETMSGINNYTVITQIQCYSICICFDYLCFVTFSEEPLQKA